MTIRAAMARLSPCRCLCQPAKARNGTDGSPSRTHKHTDQSDYEATSLHDAVLDVDERKEIARILPYLDDGEKVMVVARQSRVLPGATLVFTPNVVFCTELRTLIRNPMMLGLREHIDYYRHRDVKSVRLVRGRFTSSLMLTVPGMGTAARSSSGEGDGIISAIPHAKAEAIYRIIQGGGRCDGSKGRGVDGGGRGAARAGHGERAAGDGRRGEAAEVEPSTAAATTATATAPQAAGAGGGACP